MKISPTRLHDRLWRPLAAACLASVIAIAANSSHAGATNTTTADTSRIISIGGAVTEILYALGKDESIVGIDSTSLYPLRAAGEKPNVGYMRQLSAEGVLGLRPSMILAIAGTGPKETMAVLDATHVPMVTVPDSFSGEGIIDKIRVIAQATGAVQRGQCMIEHVRADLDALRQFEDGIGRRKRVLFVLSFVDGRAMAAGKHTAADGIIRLAGGVNAIADYDGYKMITDEAVVAAKPDVVLAMQRGGPNPVNADMVFAQQAFAATPAAAKRSFVAMDALYLLGFGPRTARAARDLAATLYPDLRREPLPSERAGDDVETCRD